MHIVMSTSVHTTPHVYIILRYRQYPSYGHPLVPFRSDKGGSTVHAVVVPVYIIIVAIGIHQSAISASREWNSALTETLWCSYSIACLNTVSLIKHKNVLKGRNGPMKQ